MTIFWILAVLAYLFLGVAVFAYAKRHPGKLGVCGALTDVLFSPAVEYPFLIIIPIFFWIVWPLVFVAGLVMQAGGTGGALRAPERTSHDARDALIGQEATATTDLKPCGKITVDGAVFDAGGINAFIPKGTRVRIVRNERFALIVEAAGDDESGDPPLPA